MKYILVVVTILLFEFGCSKTQEEVNQHVHGDIKEVAWKFSQENGWSTNAKQEIAIVSTIVVDSRFELLNENVRGENVVSVSFDDKENVVTGTPVILVDPINKKVIGYMLSE